MRQARSMVLGALVVLAALQGACSGCGEEYRCDETGCYWCDSYGCRPVDPPDPTLCRGDWECPAGQICTRTGCASECTVDIDCPEGLACRDGLCLEPGPDVACTPGGSECPDGYRCEDGNCIVDLDPGRCPTGSESECDADEFCAPSRCCLPDAERGSACCADADCDAGDYCNDGTCEAESSSDAGTDSGGDAGTDGGGGDGGTADIPIPEPQCRVNADCPDHYLCIDAVCKLPCRTDAECGAGCHCQGGFCADD